MATKKKKHAVSNTIALNRKATHDYEILQKFEAGVVLEGWEVKSLRAGRAQLTDSYVLLKNGEAFVLGSHISPLATASTHIHPDPIRTRKLLLHHKEINPLIGAVERKGFTIVVLALYWKNNRVKASIGSARGKKLHDKRASLKEKDAKREQQRAFKQFGNSD